MGHVSEFKVDDYLHENLYEYEKIHWRMIDLPSCTSCLFQHQPLEGSIDFRVDVFYPPLAHGCSY